MILKVGNILESNVAISMKKGELLLTEIENALRNEESVIVDFKEISDLTTAFLNVAIGHLYINHSREELNAKLQIINLDELDLFLLSQVIERVNLNQEKKEEFTALIKEVLSDGDDS